MYSNKPSTFPPLHLLVAGIFGKHLGQLLAKIDFSPQSSLHLFLVFAIM